MVLPIALRLRQLIGGHLTRNVSPSVLLLPNFVDVTNEASMSKSVSPREAPQLLSDPLANLAILIGQPDPFVSNREVIRVRQIPFKYYSIDYGPVYAFEVNADRTKARCVTWCDVVVELRHNDLHEFLDHVQGAKEISDLDDEVSEMLSPHMDGASRKWSPPPKATVGGFLFEQPFIWHDALHPMGDISHDGHGAEPLQHRRE